MRGENGNCSTVDTTHLGFLEVTPFLGAGDRETLELVVRRHGVDYLIEDLCHLFIVYAICLSVAILMFVMTIHRLLIVYVDFNSVRDIY